MGDLARALDLQDDPQAMLKAIVEAAVAMVPGAEEGSISVVTGRRQVTSEAPTGDLIADVDALQESVGQGPCLNSVYEQQTTRIQDMTTEDRWPVFARKAVQLGAGSMLSLQLYVEKDNLGALNLVSRTPDAFTDDSEQVGLLFAAHAAIAWSASRTKFQLQQALASRDAIGQAKGILMERYKIDSQRAFMVLVRVSQSNNRKITDVVDELITHGTIAAGA